MLSKLIHRNIFGVPCKIAETFKNSQHSINSHTNQIRINWIFHKSDSEFQSQPYWCGSLEISPFQEALNYIFTHLYFFFIEDGNKGKIIGPEGIEQFCKDLGVDPNDVSV